jgi:hypothetical protein
LELRSSCSPGAHASRSSCEKFEILKPKSETKRFGKLEILNTKYEIKPKEKQKQAEKIKTEIRNRNRTLYKFMFGGVWNPVNSSDLKNNQIKSIMVLIIPIRYNQRFRQL